MSGSHRTAAVVLAGGRATRLGGGDKPLRHIAGKPMLAHVLERLRPQVEAIALSANGDPARFSAYGLTVLADDGPGGQAGPLSGILSGMRWAREASYGCLLSAAADTPFIPADLAGRLAAAVAGRPDHISVALSGGRMHPVFALWPVSLEGDLARFLASSSTFSVAAFLERHPVKTVDFPLTTAGGKAFDPFFNVNTPEDLARAEAIVQGPRP